jgi:hypothetical protein
LKTLETIKYDQRLHLGFGLGRTCVKKQNEERAYKMHNQAGHGGSRLATWEGEIGEMAV